MVCEIILVHVTSIDTGRSYLNFCLYWCGPVTYVCWQWERFDKEVIVLKTCPLCSTITPHLNRF